MADIYSGWSPYMYGYDSPLTFNDPAGAEPQGGDLSTGKPKNPRENEERLIQELMKQGSPLGTVVVTGKRDPMAAEYARALYKWTRWRLTWRRWGRVLGRMTILIQGS